MGTTRDRVGLWLIGACGGVGSATSLGIAALASQKNYMSLYLMSVYSNKETEQWFLERYRASGEKLDIGKSCVRFRRLEDLPLDLVGKVIARTSVEGFIGNYEASRKQGSVHSSLT